jgi:hypothetical protein
MYEVSVMLFNMQTKEDDIIETHIRDNEEDFIRLVRILLDNLPSDYTLSISQNRGNH